MSPNLLKATLLCGITAGAPIAFAGASEPLCERIGAKLTSVSASECLAVGLVPDGRTASGTPIVVREFPPARSDDVRRVLLISGTHGDEYSSVSIIFKWLQLDRSPSLHWCVVPLLNPDGLLRKESTRVNARGVDLNRNLPMPDWARKTDHYWQRHTGRDPRRYPGPAPASEPETRWLVAEINAFQPDAIVSVHARYGNFVYDGPGISPHGLGDLRQGQLDYYPGTLGEYAGNHLGIPVLTLELPHAGILPDEDHTRRMWVDLQDWLIGVARVTNTVTSDAEPVGCAP